ncbi:DUF927 domain-containing protein [Methylobacterium sp. WL12]|nr:DUF927 domain-containing protein [Methylobacterium sp. WL12]
MGIKLCIPATAPRGQSAPGCARREKPIVRGRLGQAPTPGVLDRVHDQHGGAWVRYGTPLRALWIPVADFARQEVFSRLADIDPRLIEPAAQRALRTEIAHSGTYRSALIATAPGWTAQHFVLGNAAMLAPPVSEHEATGRETAEHEVIITFAPHPKFTPRGSLMHWQAALGPLVTEQPFLLFGLALAFVGPLLPFVPSDYLSPLFEFAGEPGSGKSLTGMVAMSVWAGDPNSTEAGGETWNLSPGRFDAVKLAHRHGLLLLDEANLAGTLDARRSLIQQAIFGMTSSGMRQRYGDPVSGPQSQLAVISTSNRPLRDLIEGAPAEREALHQRMITIPVAATRAHGIFDFIPSGYESAAQAAEALRGRVDEQWGTAGSVFVQFVQNNIAHDEGRFRELLARGLAHHRDRLSGETDRPRVQKCLALVAVAGLLARRWGVLPTQWGSPAEAVQAVARMALSGTGVPSDPRAVVHAYVERHRAALVEVENLDRPLTKADFEAAVGFLRAGRDGTEVLIPAERFRVEFAAHAVLMRALRAAGHAQTEPGRNSKLTIKTPRAICREGRVYCIRFSE